MTFVTPLTPAPTPPNIGSPSTFPALASTFVAWQAASATEFNTAIGQINALDFGILFATYGGTANAITLIASGVTALFTGLQITFIPTAANTGATTINLNGLGVVAAQPLASIGVALPGGYIVANAPVTAIYNGTVWLIRRNVESRVLINKTVISGEPTSVQLSWGKTLYSKISLVLQNFRPLLDSGLLYMYLSNNGGSSNITAGYRRQVMKVAGGAATFEQATSQSVIVLTPTSPIGADANETGVSGGIDIFPWDDNQYTSVTSQLAVTGDTNQVELVQGAHQSTDLTGEVNAIQLNFNTGSIAGGIVSLYGERNT